MQADQAAQQFALTDNTDVQITILISAVIPAMIFSGYFRKNAATDVIHQPENAKARTIQATAQVQVLILVQAQIQAQIQVQIQAQAAAQVQVHAQQLTAICGLRNPQTI